MAESEGYWFLRFVSVSALLASDPPEGRKIECCPQQLWSLNREAGFLNRSHEKWRRRGCWDGPRTAVELEERITSSVLGLRDSPWDGDGVGVKWGALGV